MTRSKKKLKQVVIRVCKPAAAVHKVEYSMKSKLHSSESHVSYCHSNSREKSRTRKSYLSRQLVLSAGVCPSLTGNPLKRLGIAFEVKEEPSSRKIEVKKKTSRLAMSRWCSVVVILGSRDYENTVSLS